MFSPSQLLQSLGQRSQVSLPKPVELSPGQVFKGTVIKQYPDNMALVQIGGMQVQAKMEANLEPGQKAWLQVQPSTDVVTFKVLESSSAAGGQDTSMESLIRSMGLTDTKENRAIAQALLNANLPVSKETVQAFTNVAQRLGMSDSTVEAFLLAVKRNLPLTPDTIAGLKAFLSEKPLGQMIQSFLEQAGQYLDDSEKGAMPTGQQSTSQGQPNQTAGADIRQVVRQLQDKLAALPVMVADTDKPDAPAKQAGVNRLPNVLIEGESAMKPASTPAAQTSGQSAVGTGQPGNAQAGMAAPLQSNSNSLKSDSNLVPLNVTQPGNPSEPMSGTTVAQAGKPVNGNNAPEASLRNPVGTPLTIENAGKSAASPAPAMSPVPTGAVLASQPDKAAPLSNGRTDELPRSAASSLSVGLQESTIQSPSRTHPLQELFRQMGITHERDLMGHALSGNALDAGVQKQMETVKSLLMQISQSQAQAVPAALREAADQLLQQVTGQQLMMLQPSNQALSQIVMQIPIRTGEGDDTAYVQIESKKKGSGEVDAENCRLFFHLELQTVGTTMIDVGIVNRIVNVQIFNDTPWIESLAHSMRDSFAQQMQEVGFQLSAMRIQPIPEQRSNISATASTKDALLSTYKGVDLRI